jgi:hypothetical protein
MVGIFRRSHRFAFLIAGLFANICAADALTLPLQGYFHPGRAMPVRWEFSQSPPGGSEIILSGDGAVTSRVSQIALPEGIFPWMVLQADVNHIRAQTPAGVETISQPLHPLTDAQKLVGVAGNDVAAASQLFPGEEIVPIRLDSLHPISGPAMAWESLDGLILTPGQWQDIPQNTRRDLFAAGVKIAVSGDNPPQESFHWQQTSRWWIARSVSLPLAVNPDALTPTEGWIAGTPADLGREIVLLGVLFGIFATGIGLWRSRWMPPALAVFSAGFCSIIASEYSAPRIAEAGGIVQIAQPAELADSWTYLESHRDADFNVAAPGIAIPILSDPSQSATCNLVLNCDSAGQPISLSGRLKADEPIALLSRAIAGQIDPVLAPVTSPLRALATPAIYPGLSVAGQLSNEQPATGAETRWPTILLK